MAYIEAKNNFQNDLDLDIVRDFIISNPDFIRQDEELLNAIATDPQNGNIVSIAELARNRMMRETREAKSRFAQIVENARANYESQIRVQEAVISVLDAETAEDLKDRLSGHVAFSLAADACVIAISESYAGEETIDKLGSFIERIVPIERPVHIGSVDRERAWLYGTEAKNIRSEAMARIEFGQNRRIAILSIASADINCFCEDMGQELIHFFARIVERVLTRLEAEEQI